MQALLSRSRDILQSLLQKSIQLSTVTDRRLKLLFHYLSPGACTFVYYRYTQCNMFYIHHLYILPVQGSMLHYYIFLIFHSYSHFYQIFALQRIQFIEYQYQQCLKKTCNIETDMPCTGVLQSSRSLKAKSQKLLEHI